MSKKKESRKMRVLRKQAQTRKKKGKELTPSMQKALGMTGEKK
jgi:hypothetical protein